MIITFLYRMFTSNGAREKPKWPNTESFVTNCKKTTENIKNKQKSHTKRSKKKKNDLICFCHGHARFINDVTDLTDRRQSNNQRLCACHRKRIDHVLAMRAVNCPKTRENEKKKQQNDTTQWWQMTRNEQHSCCLVKWFASASSYGTFSTFAALTWFRFW